MLPCRVEFDDESQRHPLRPGVESALNPGVLAGAKCRPCGEDIAVVVHRQGFTLVSGDGREVVRPPVATGRHLGDERVSIAGPILTADEVVPLSIDGDILDPVGIGAPDISQPLQVGRSRCF